jgi:ribonuclease HI
MNPGLLEKVFVYTDGGSRGNPGPSAIGILIYSPEGKFLKDYREYIGKATNNQAEYAAVLKALEMASDYTKEIVTCYSDSNLLVNQLSGRFKAKNKTIKEALEKVREAERIFSRVTYTYLPRTDPRMRLADKLVNMALG